MAGQGAAPGQRAALGVRRIAALPVEDIGYLCARIDASGLAADRASVGVGDAGRTTAEVQAVGQATGGSGADGAAVADSRGRIVAAYCVGIARATAGADEGICRIAYGYVSARLHAKSVAAAGGNSRQAGPSAVGEYGVGAAI